MSKRYNTNDVYGPENRFKISSDLRRNFCRDFGYLENLDEHIPVFPFSLFLTLCARTKKRENIVKITFFWYQVGFFLHLCYLVFLQRSLA